MCRSLKESDGIFVYVCPRVNCTAPGSGYSGNDLNLLVINSLNGIGYPNPQYHKLLREEMFSCFNVTCRNNHCNKDGLGVHQIGNVLQSKSLN